MQVLQNERSFLILIIIKLYIYISRSNQTRSCVIFLKFFSEAGLPKTKFFLRYSNRIKQLAPTNTIFPVVEKNIYRNNYMVSMLI